MARFALIGRQHLEEAVEPDAECDQDEHGGKDEHASQTSAVVKAPNVRWPLRAFRTELRAFRTDPGSWPKPGCRCPGLPTFAYGRHRRPYAEMTRSWGPAYATAWIVPVEG
ncbi:hypothetical protein GCM10023191_075790 [Actinoallomurus oryzae]|uniref:Uncharacterized protein n=1 Tax=Actinoallomurus oryzae TaxID=502180 RepID=A0ABP8QW02_9ACTN